VPVGLIATGGTIASLRDPETGAVRPAVSAQDLVASTPGLAASEIARVEEVAAVNGWNMTPALMLEVARAARSLLEADDVEGVVVTHGTDTVEETAFVSDILVDSLKPVVFAAAMRSGDEVSADGPRNLLAAFRVAAAPEARGAGSVVVMNDEIHAARWVRKLDSFRVSALASPGTGPIGVLAPDGLRLEPPSSRVNVSVPRALDGHPVPVIQTYTGMEETLIEVVLDHVGAVGLVLEGTGLGNVPGGAARGVEAALKRGIPVIVATRTPGGGTGAVYGGPGGAVTLQGMGAIPARRLSAAKARLLLMALLASGASSEAAAMRFASAARELL
jgi:L-asparaginase